MAPGHFAPVHAAKRPARRAWRGVRHWRASLRSGGLAARGLILLLGLGAAAPAMAQELVYFHEKGCPYCDMWEEDIGPVYGKTWEGERFPLRKEPLSKGIPDDLTIDRAVQFTPTFVLVDDQGREVGRVLGYNPEWFWAFLDRQIEKYDRAKAGD